MFHMFEWNLKEEPSVTLQPDEHQAYRWLTTKEALTMGNLIHDLEECIQLVERP